MHQTIKRFSLEERLVHWMAALSFLYAALTGLALWTPALYWLASVFGGGSLTRMTHPWAGLVFLVAIGLMFLSWARQMRLDREDREWLKKSHLYALHQEEGLPEPGRFNAGQKMLFWTQVVVTAILFASGVFIWFPEIFSRQILVIAVLIHATAAVVSIGTIIVHIYMGTLAVPGSMHAMVRGEVSERWAASHHPKWYRQTRDQ